MTENITDPKIEREIKRKKTRVGDENNKSPDGYIDDLRWLDDVLENIGVPTDEVEYEEIDHVILQLCQDFNDGTIADHWDRLEDFYELLERRELIEKNPFDFVTKEEYGIEYIKDPEIKAKIDRIENRIGSGDNQIDNKSSDRYIDDLEWLDDVLADIETPSDEVEYEEIDHVLSKLAKDYNGSTVGNRWGRLKEFYNSLERKELIEKNPFKFVQKKEYGVSYQTEQSKYYDDDIYAPSEEEIQKMVQNVNSDQDRLRDQLLILLMYHTACRCDEIRKIKFDDIDRDKREIELREKVTKNSKSRTVRYGESLDDLMYKWIDGGLRDRRKFSDSPYLFISQQSGQMSKSIVNEVVRKAAINAGVNEVMYVDASGNDRWKITSHSLRHSCATHMINNGADIYRVSKYLGHSSVEITEDTYIHENDRTGVDEAHKLGPQ
jgi:integrase/recombinase XerD